jgi:hypothetical protein
VGVALKALRAALLALRVNVTATDPDGTTKTYLVKYAGSRRA